MSFNKETYIIIQVYVSKVSKKCHIYLYILKYFLIDLFWITHPTIGSWVHIKPKEKKLLG